MAHKLLQTFLRWVGLLAAPTTPRIMQGVERTDATHILTLSAKGVLDQRYSSTDVYNATRSAFCYMPSLTCNSTIHDDIPGAVRILHILTSDEAWGVGGSNLVAPYFKIKVRVFLRDLLGIVEPIDSLRDQPSVVNFIVSNFGCMHHPDFVRILRAYLMAFPQTHGFSGVNLGDGDRSKYTALLLAARDNRVPVIVLKTLLEGGVDVCGTSEDGDTALMLAVENCGKGPCEKVRLLLTYGADICAYNLCLHNAIHIAVNCMNVNGLLILLDARKERLLSHVTPELQTATSSSDVVEFSTRLCMRGRLDPDPLHLPDKKYNTPLSTVVHSEWVNYKTRREVVELLVDAGAQADSDVDYEGRVTLARQSRGLHALPHCFGVITSQLFGHSFTVFAVIRKPGYTVNLRIGNEVVEQFVDMDRSVLPPGNMSNFLVTHLLLGCVNQRFSFDADIDGIDLDIHFNDVGDNGRYTSVVDRDSGAPFKLALRFPRGPCPINFWIPGSGELFSEITIDKKYTLAHIAVMNKCSPYLLHMTRSLCNPLRTCADGFSAAETLQRQFHGRRVGWDIKRLISSMWKDRISMLEYIHKDAELFLRGSTATTEQQLVAVERRLYATRNVRYKKALVGGGSKKKKRSYKNPFDELPDDVCIRIVHYVVL